MTNETKGWLFGLALLFLLGVGLGWYLKGKLEKPSIAQGSVTITQYSVKYLPAPTKENPNPTPVIIHHGPAANPVIAPGENGKQIISVPWAGLTVQPWIGIDWAGQGFEWMGGIGILYFNRDLTEVGPIIGQRRSGIGINGRWRHYGLGLGWTRGYKGERGFALYAQNYLF